MHIFAYGGGVQKRQIYAYYITCERTLIVLYWKEKTFLKMLLILISFMKLKFVDKHLHWFFRLYENANNIMYEDVFCLWWQEIVVLPMFLKKLVSINRSIFLYVRHLLIKIFNTTIYLFTWNGLIHLYILFNE